MSAVLKIQSATVTNAVEVTPELMQSVAEKDAKGLALEVITQQVNREVDYGYEGIVGVPNPRIDRDGRQIDVRYRGYAISEIASVLALPQTQEVIACMKAEAEARAADARRDRNVEQLRLARRKQAAMAEHRQVPLLYAEVQELRRVVETLIDQLDRVAPGSVAKLVGDMTEPLPQIE